MYRHTWMEVDLDAIMDNVKTIQEIAHKKIIAVLKADAYGCGDMQVARAVLEAGAEMIAVSSLDEALMLRNEGFDVPILILGVVDPKDIDILIEHQITTAAFSLSWVKEVIQRQCEGLLVHLKIDTGMNRIGFKDVNELLQAKEMLLNAGVVLDGVFTHFFCSDSKDHVVTNRQYEQFAKEVKLLDYPFRWIHCDNSDATIFFKDELTNAGRVGISLYGISPYRNDLKHALGLYTKVLQVKKVPAHETVGYGGTYETSQDEWIGTMPIGYADGFIRANQNRNVYVEGEYAPIRGRVCMDQTMVSLPRQIDEGSIVEIFGKHILLEDMAKELDTIPYEIICLISGRVTRVYKKNGKVIAEANERLLKSIQIEMD